MSKTVDIDYLLEEVITLPSLPTTIARITELVNNPDSTLGELGRAISVDPAISLKSLRLVNSAYYGLVDKVTSVEHAVVLLGLKVVKNIVFTAAVFDTLQSGEETLLRHNIAVAVAMRSLVESGAAKNVHIDQPEEAFTCGLLHDVGKIIIQQHLPEDFEEVKKRCASGDITWGEAEKEVIGIDHADMGARLAQHWKLTDELANAIQGHHNPGACPNADMKALAALVNVANYICFASGMPGMEGVPTQLDADAFALAGIANEDLPKVMESFFQSAPEIEELISMAS